MKKRYLLTILVAITSLFVGLSGVKGVTNDPLNLIKIDEISSFGGEVESGLEGIAVGESVACRSEICANVPKYGIYVSIITDTGSVVAEKEIWADELNTYAPAFAKLKIVNRAGIESPNYKEFIEAIGSSEVLTNKIIQKVTGTSKTYEDYNLYYFKIEPYIQFRMSHWDFCGKSGVTEENVTVTLADGSTAVRHRCYRNFYKASQKNGRIKDVISAIRANTYGNPNVIDVHSRGCAEDFINGNAKYGCIPAGNWKLFQNYLLDPKTPNSGIGKSLYGYYNYSGQSIKSVMDAYLDNEGHKGLGIGIIKINNFTAKVNIVKKNSKGLRITSKETKLKIVQTPKTAGPGLEQLITIETPETPLYHTSLMLNSNYNYTISEEMAPLGYADDDLPSRDFQVESGKEYVITIKNLTICEKDLEKLNATHTDFTTADAKLALIETYYKLKSDHNLNYQGLLDFENPSCSYISRAVKPTIDCFDFEYGYEYKKETETGKTDASGNIILSSPSLITTPSFNGNNVSLFHNEPIIYTSHSGKKTYVFCQQQYKFDGQKSNNPSVKSGIPLWVSEDISGALFANAKYENNCYAYGSAKSQFMLKVVKDWGEEIDFNVPYNSADANLFDPREKVQNIKLDVDGSSESQITISKETKSYDISNALTTGQIKTSTELEYSTPQLYAYYGSGARYMGTDFTPEFLKANGIKSIGYGIWTKLNASGTNDMLFAVEYYDDASGGGWKSVDTGNACKYTATPEIIINDKLNLEYRTIDTNNPFPGSNANADGRTVGANWCYKRADDTYNCDIANNPLIAEYISGGIAEGTTYNKPADSYTQNYKYRITLTPDDIKAIRAYNENHSYDDWTVDYDYDASKTDDENTKKHVGKFFNDILDIAIDIN